MKSNIFLLIFIMLFNYSEGQQVINIVLDPSAYAIRGVAIPGMLGTAASLKNEQASTIIPAIVNEERSLMNKWRGSVLSNINVLNALSISSRTLINSIDAKKALISPIHYVPGYRKELREFDRLRSRTERLEQRVATLVGIGTFFIDGEGYYRNASQRLAVEYLEVYARLSKIDFNLGKLVVFINLLPLIAT
ncbi:hypothetical protein OOZ15_18350 [Galbibacter sp. EGI 63066]|uniref:hypothetical protein n=1 Tax=Galbibacter sp. EGI 63066 TaxID=2993559 RepID=UPI002248D33F|nr:hypothetical protein [Galbibacter sp. EGI 63066]MCX2681919.1 hypothetical protein [Galbibacter sp. EGI 63066]